MAVIAAGFVDAIRAAGIQPPDMIEADRSLHRFSSNGIPADDSGWYVFYDDGIPAGAFGCWRSGISETWRADIGRKLSPQEEAAHRTRIEQARRKAQAERERGHAEAAKKAAAIWKAATPASADHPYLTRKRVPPAATLREIDAGAAAAILAYAPKSKGELLSGRLLVTPVKVGDAFSTAELIDEAGRKSAIYGGAKGGGYWAAQPLPHGDGAGLVMTIGEGVATVLSGREATGHLAIAALSAGNLPAVAKAMRERYPAVALVILADLVKATGAPDPHAIEAARSAGGLVAIPDFGANRPADKKDFNDLHQIRGREAVERAIASASAPAREVHQPGAGNAAAGDSVGTEWPEPLPMPEGLPAVAPFDFTLLPETLRPWAEDIAERVQCAPEFPAVGAMISAAAVLGRKIGLRPKRKDDWLEVPNLWGGIIGRPGVLKSPALREAMRPLRRLEAKAGEAFNDEAAAWRQKSELAKLKREAERSNLVKVFKKDSNAVATLADDFSEDEPQARRYLVNDTSHEALGVVLQHNPNGVLAYRDELVGLLKSLDKEGMESARGFFLTAWSGTEAYTFDRIGRGLNQRIAACCLSLLGSIQPAKIGGYLRQAVEGAGDDGLLSRFQLLVWPDVSGEWRDVDDWPDSEAKATANETFDRLDTLDPQAIGATLEDGEIPYLRFDEAAQELFSEWRAKLEKRLRSGEDHPAVEAHLAKYRKLVPALALLTHLADQSAGAVGEVALLKALAWAEYLESHARRAYASVTQAEAEGARALLNRIRRGEVPDPFVARDVYLKHWACLSKPEEVHQAVRLLADLDYLRIEEQPTGGRTKSAIWINPKVKQA